MEKEVFEHIVNQGKYECNAGFPNVYVYRRMRALTNINKRGLSLPKGSDALKAEPKLKLFLSLSILFLFKNSSQPS